MDWSKEKHDWPNAGHSRFIAMSGMQWHVQHFGKGPKVLMLHGSGATTHSFADLIDELKDDHEILTLDLPGHGFSSNLGDGPPSLENVANAIGQLLKFKNFEPDVVIAHSAGAAIAVELVHRQHLTTDKIFAINGAFYPFPGFAGTLFPALAKLLFLNPFVPSFFSMTASRDRVESLIRSTGSKLTDKQTGYYERALHSSDHVHGTLAMMANWDLETMAAKLKNLEANMVMLIGGQDGTIDPANSIDAAKLVKSHERIVLPDYGHLVHEEAPLEVAGFIRHQIGHRELVRA
jgi:magnesium chelatase accessory protein